jgi:hypothetical protein
MTLDLGGQQVIYTQKFSAVPEQWPKPLPGRVGLGTLVGEIGRTSTFGVTSRNGKRSVQTPTSVPVVAMDALVRRCRTTECRRMLQEALVS